MTLEALIRKARDELSRATNHETWIVGFSGGKDSSVLVDLVLRFKEAEGRPSRIYIVYSDTLLEPPPLRGYAIGVVKAVDGILDGVYGIVVSPLDTDTDIVEMVIVRGYPAPSARFRWCTDRWKLQPSRKFVQRLGLKSTPAVITGVRAEEAAHRAKRMQGADLRDVIGGVAYMPLLEWSARDVWAYIDRYTPYWQAPDWGMLRKLYGGEDTIRTGCWACTVIAHERAWLKLVKQGLISAEFYRLVSTWRDLYHHFSRIRPDLWRHRKILNESKWRYHFGKLRPEARLALGECLERILTHPEYPSDTAKQLLEKLGKALETLEEYRISLQEMLTKDVEARKLLHTCLST